MDKDKNFVGSKAEGSKIPFRISAEKRERANGLAPYAEVRIIGTIGWETDAEAFRRAIDGMVAEGVEDVHIYIHSPGGSCFDAAEIVNIMSAFKGKVTGEGGALVASAATYIALNCKSFSMPENGQFMIHKPSGVAIGNVRDIENYAKLMRDIEAEYHDIYAARAKDKAVFEEKWNGGDWWMNAKEAKDAGFICEVRSQVKIDREASAMLIAASAPGLDGVKQTDSNFSNNQNKLEMKLIALALGLDENATEEQILAKMRELQKTAATATDLSKQVEGMQTAQITTLVEAAVAARKITADKKEHFVSLGKSAGIDSLRATLDCMAPEVKPTDVIRQRTAGGAAAKFSDLKADEREKLRAENPSEYARLYKEEYGIECRIEK